MDKKMPKAGEITLKFAKQGEKIEKKWAKNTHFKNYQNNAKMRKNTKNVL